MMKYKKITELFEFMSKVCAVMTPAAIVFSTAATNILFPITAFFSLIAGNWRTKFIQLAHNPVVIIFLIFYLLFIIGIFYSTASWPDMLLMLRKYDKFLFAILFVPLFTEERWRKLGINTFLLAIFIILAIAYLVDYGWLPFIAKTGSIGVFKDYIVFNFLMAFSAYLFLFKIVTNTRYAWFWLICLLFVSYTVLFRSSARSGYFVFAGLVGLFFFQRMRWCGLLLTAISVVILFGLAFTFSPVFKERINLIFSEVKIYHKDDNTSVGLRISFVKNSMKLIKKHPILGTGTGSFAHEYATVKTTPTNNPHNEYVYITVQFGVLGLIILLLFFGIPVFYSRFLPEDQKYIAQGTVLGIMIGCLANSWLLDTTQGHFYAYFIAFAFSVFPIKRNLINCSRNS